MDRCILYACLVLASVKIVTGSIMINENTDNSNNVSSSASHIVNNQTNLSSGNDTSGDIGNRSMTTTSNSSSVKLNLNSTSINAIQSNQTDLNTTVSKAKQLTSPSSVVEKVVNDELEQPELKTFVRANADVQINQTKGRSEADQMNSTNTSGDTIVSRNVSQPQRLNSQSVITEQGGSQTISTTTAVRKSSAGQSTLQHINTKIVNKPIKKYARKATYGRKRQHSRSSFGYGKKRESRLMKQISLADIHAFSQLLNQAHVFKSDISIQESINDFMKRNFMLNRTPVPAYHNSIHHYNYECMTDMHCGRQARCINGKCECNSCHGLDEFGVCIPMCGDYEICKDDQCICKECFKRNEMNDYCEPRQCGLGICLNDECECPTCTYYNKSKDRCEELRCGNGQYCNGDGICVCGPCFEQDEFGKCRPKNCGVPSAGYCDHKTNSCRCTDCHEIKNDGKCGNIDCGYNGYCIVGEGCLCPKCHYLDKETGKCKYIDCGYGASCNRDTGNCTCDHCFIRSGDNKCTLQHCGDGGLCNYKNGQCECKPCHYMKNGTCTARYCGSGSSGYCDSDTDTCTCNKCYEMKSNGTCGSVDCGEGGYCLNGTCECSVCHRLGPDGKCTRLQCKGGHCNPQTDMCECDRCHMYNKSIDSCEAKDCGMGGWCDLKSGDCQCQPCHALQMGKCQSLDCGPSSSGSCDPMNNTCSCLPCHELQNGTCTRMNCGVNSYCNSKNGCQCDLCHIPNENGECNKSKDCGQGGKCYPKNGECFCIDSCHQLNKQTGKCELRQCGDGGWCDLKSGQCKCQPCHRLVEGKCRSEACVGGYCDPYQNKCVCADCYEPVLTNDNTFECKLIDCGLGYCSEGLSCKCPNCTSPDENGRKCSWTVDKCGTGHCDVKTNTCVCPMCDVKDDEGKCVQVTCGANSECNPVTKTCECNKCFKERLGRCIYGCSRYARCGKDGCRCKDNFFGDGKICRSDNRFTRRKWLRWK